MSTINFSPEETQRECHLRAIEWVTWPAFLSQPILPIAYIYWPVYQVLLFVAAIGLLWVPFRYRFVNLRLATLGCFWVKLKWVTIPLCLAILAYKARYVAAIAAAATPLIAGLLNLPGQIGVVERKFAVAVLLTRPGVTLSLLDEEANRDRGEATAAKPPTLEEQAIQPPAGRPEQAETYREAQAVRTAPATVKIMITSDDIAALRDLGYDEAAIDKMKPAEVHEVLAKRRRT